MNAKQWNISMKTELSTYYEKCIYNYSFSEYINGLDNSELSESNKAEVGLVNQ